MIVVINWRRLRTAMFYARVEAKMKKSFTPALGYSRLTPLYDIAIRLLTRERVWRNFLVKQVGPQPTDRIVDIGCGTGSLAIRLKKTEPGAEIIGLDPDADVLARARQKAQDQNIDIRWMHGRACGHGRQRSSQYACHDDR